MDNELLKHLFCSFNWLDYLASRYMFKKIFTTVFIILLLVFAKLPLRSQDSIQYKWEKFSVSLGGFLTTMNCNLSIDGQLGLGVNIDLEKALGLSTVNTVFRGEVEYNFGSKRRSHIRMGYFGFNRNASKTLESELEIGNSVYPAGTKLESKFNMRIFRGLYDFSYFKDKRINLSVSAGLYMLPIQYSVGSDTLINESDSFIAPFPVVGFQNSFFIAPKVILKQNVEVMYYQDPNFKGYISDINVWLEYNPFKHFGFGLGYNSFRFNFTAYERVDDVDFRGSVSTGFSGLLFYGKYYF